MTRPDDIGPALREERLADGLTQAALAELANVGRQWLNSFEMGEKVSAPLNMVMRVIAALDVAVVLTRPSLAATGAKPEAAEVFDLDEHLREYDQ
ncbi:transcriptional regulator with XRE-family HTH domain [Nocardioides daedukensis]|uniref:Transcriptional regulator with XRE-family HTH domain n=1 Tax=Nocardioides daedukensis TaxID=634462 RepID=A0A7Y9UVG8_9ACTN|nr:transcriptional regulator with XRE-family HTH domain [Nocardioides daedukensis]